MRPLGFEWVGPYLYFNAVCDHRQGRYAATGECFTCDDGSDCDEPSTIAHYSMDHVMECLLGNLRTVVALAAAAQQERERK